MKGSSVLPLHSVYIGLAVVLSAPYSSRAWHPSSALSPSTTGTMTTTTALSMTAMPRKKSQQQQDQDLPVLFDLDWPRDPQQQQQQQGKHQRSILDDGHGHVNPDLAATLWQWEQQHRQEAKLPKMSFSTRQGLRLVDQIVTEITTSPRGQRFMRGNDDIRTDLIQDGMIALLDVFNAYRLQFAPRENHFDDDILDVEEMDYYSSDTTTAADTVDPNAQFEAFARPYLQDVLWSTLDKTSRPVQLPETESLLWKKVQQIRPQLQAELGGRSPTTPELAARLNLPTKRLETLLAARRGALSMENTIEIKNPESLEDQNAHFTDVESWDSRQGHYLLDTTGGGVSNKDILVEEYQNEADQYEGDDEMWIHQTQVAAPLRDIIPDGEPSSDDIALSDMIRHDVGAFLTKTLTPEEVQVVRLAFGLDTADGATESPLTMWEEIAYPMKMEPLEVKKVLKSAVEKLRMSYQSDYVQKYEDGDLFEDSV